MLARTGGTAANRISGGRGGGDRRAVRPTGQDATASPEALGRPATGATPDTAATNDMAVAFAGPLEAELKGLLGLPAEVRASRDELRQVEARANDELRQDKDEGRRRAGRLLASPERHPWWRRLAD